MAFIASSVEFLDTMTHMTENMLSYLYSNWKQILLTVIIVAILVTVMLYYGLMHGNGPEPEPIVLEGIANILVKHESQGKIELGDLENNDGQTNIAEISNEDSSNPGPQNTNSEKPNDQKNNNLSEKDLSHDEQSITDNEPDNQGIAEPITPVGPILNNISEEGEDMHQQSVSSFSVIDSKINTPVSDNTETDNFNITEFHMPLKNEVEGQEILDIGNNQHTERNIVRQKVVCPDSDQATTNKDTLPLEKANPKALASIQLDLISNEYFMDATDDNTPNFTKSMWAVPQYAHNLATANQYYFTLNNPTSDLSETIANVR